MEVPKKHERLMELIGLLRDAGPGQGLDDSQASELESILQNDSQALAYYVESMDVIAMLHRQQGLVVQDSADGEIGSAAPASTTSVKVASANRGWWSVAGFSVAICASLAIGVLTGRLTIPSNDDSPQGVGIHAAGDEASEIATLSSASGCRWDPRDESRYEGQRLGSGPLRLIEGVAVVHFDSDVSLVLEGPAHLELANVDHAMLHRGKAVFSGADDLDQFTLETPFSKIQDEGTEYAVSVDPESELEEIHVFDGRVICDPANNKPTAAPDQSIKLDAGEARRFDGPRSMESIKIDSSRFIRKPLVQADSTESTTAIESFAYDRESLAGLDGGSGWKTPWSQPIRYDSNQGGTMRTNASLLWPGRSSDTESGSLLIEGNAGLHRTLREPIRMDRDAAYYISFLVRKDPSTKASGPRGWACITLRTLADKKGSITIGPRGKPHVSHDGRSTKGTRQLRDGIVYLFACKISARKNKDDQVTVRIYADDETVDSVEPSAWSISTRPIRNDSVLSEFRLYSANSDPFEIDEILIGKTWASVTSPYNQ